MDPSSVGYSELESAVDLVVDSVAAMAGMLDSASAVLLAYGWADATVALKALTPAVC